MVECFYYLPSNNNECYLRKKRKENNCNKNLNTIGCNYHFYLYCLKGCN